MDTCPFSSKPIFEKRQVKYPNIGFGETGISYSIKWFGKSTRVNLCPSFFKQSDEKLIGEKRLQLCNYLFNLEKSKNKIIHFGCNKLSENDLILKDVINVLPEIHLTNISRRRKKDIVLETISKIVTYDGQTLSIKEFDIEALIAANLSNYEELFFYLSELIRSNFIDEAEANFYKISLAGHEYLETVNDNKKTNSTASHYQVSLSFAGEEREYAQRVAATLKSKNVSVFYDDYEEVNLWGMDLYQHLNDIYKNKSEYCIVFISESYANKLWTRHELKSAQTRAFTENREYILPVKLDDTELPGIDATVGYVDGRKKTPEEIAELAFQKINRVAN